MTSIHLRAFKRVWRDACHSMWVEATALRYLESHVFANYSSLGNSDLTDHVWAPFATGRLGDFTRDSFLEGRPTYFATTVTNRVVLLSAAFEQYFSHFVADYLVSREPARYHDIATGELNAEGTRVSGSIFGRRGMVPKLRGFSEETGALIRGIEGKIPYLSDVYLLRNVIAHRAGDIDRQAADNLETLHFDEGDRVVLTHDQLITLADPVVKIAEFLDRKLR